MTLVVDEHAVVSACGLTREIDTPHTGQCRGIGCGLCSRGRGTCRRHVDQPCPEEHADRHDGRDENRHSSSSLATMSATEVTCWPASTAITFTPEAPRPCDEMVRTSVRMVTPFDATATISSSMPAMNADTT